MSEAHPYKVFEGTAVTPSAHDPLQRQGLSPGCIAPGWLWVHSLSENNRFSAPCQISWRLIAPRQPYGTFLAPLSSQPLNFYPPHAHLCNNSFIETTFAYHTFHPFKMPNSVVVSIFTELYSYHHSQF